MILSISVKELRKQLAIQLAVTVFVAFFGAVYEYFGRGVYSYFMIYAFAFPLVMGVVPYSIMLMREKYPDRVFLNLWNSAIAALCVGSIFAGVLAIAGYTNAKILVYQIAGLVLAVAAVVSQFLRQQREPTSEITGNDDTTA